MSMLSRIRRFAFFAMLIVGLLPSPSFGGDACPDNHVCDCPNPAGYYWAAQGGCGSCGCFYASACQVEGIGYDVCYCDLPCEG